MKQGDHLNIWMLHSSKVFVKKYPVGRLKTGFFKYYLLKLLTDTIYAYFGDHPELQFALADLLVFA